MLHGVLSTALAGAAILALALLGGRWVARRARFRRLVLEYLAPGGWTRGGQLRERFGAGIYPTLRDLEQLGLVARREGPSTITELVARGGGAVVWYRVTLAGAERLARTDHERKGA